MPARFLQTGPLRKKDGAVRRLFACVEGYFDSFDAEEQLWNIEQPEQPPQQPPQPEPLSSPPS